MSYAIPNWTFEDIETNYSVESSVNRYIWKKVQNYPVTYTDEGGQYVKTTLWVHWPTEWRGGVATLTHSMRIQAFCTLPAGQNPQRPSVLDPASSVLPAGNDLTLPVLGSNSVRGFAPINSVNYIPDPTTPTTTIGFWRLLLEPHVVGYENKQLGTLRWRVVWISEGKITKALRWLGELTVETFIKENARTLEDAMPYFIEDLDPEE